MIALLAMVTAAAAPFLYWPVEDEAARINSGWYYADRYGGACHRGLDIIPSQAAATVLAAADGVVTLTADDQPNTWCSKEELDAGCVANPKSYGNQVRILHDNGFTTLYGHLKTGMLHVFDGDIVVAGQPLGQINDSGYSTADHLHFEVWDAAGVKVDPFAIYDGPVAYPGDGADLGPSADTACVSGDAGYLWLSVPPTAAALGLSGTLDVVAVTDFYVQVEGTAHADEGLSEVSLAVGDEILYTWKDLSGTDEVLAFGGPAGEQVSPGTYTLALWVEDTRGATQIVASTSITLDAGISGSLDRVQIVGSQIEVEGSATADAGLDVVSVVVGRTKVMSFEINGTATVWPIDDSASLSGVPPGTATVALWVRDMDGNVTFVDTESVEVPAIVDTGPELLDVMELDGDLLLQGLSGGTFTMGCTAGQGAECGDDEYPAHEVTLTDSFYIGVTEVTQRQFETYVGYNPSWYSLCGGDCPVEYLSTDEMQAFANAVSLSIGAEACYECSGSGSNVSCEPLDDIRSCGGFRMLTEAEWEYSARCGTDMRYAGSDSLADVGWTEELSGGATHPVAELSANACGLYDMSGNVSELVADWYGETYYSDGAATDPTGPVDGTEKVWRGGDYHNTSNYGRVAWRAGTDLIDETSCCTNIGFRLGRTYP